MPLGRSLDYVWFRVRWRQRQAIPCHSRLFRHRQLSDHPECPRNRLTRRARRSQYSSWFVDQPLSWRLYVCRRHCTFCCQGYGHVAGEATLTAGGRGGDGDTSQHAALVGLSGQSNARFAIDSDGSLHWGDGTNDTFHTSMLGAQSSTCDAKLLTIPANGVAKACVIVLWTNGDNPTTGKDSLDPSLPTFPYI
jgi:hypothetical protein